MDPEFSYHDHRHQLKQLRDAGNVKLFANRDELRCPVCSEVFERLMILATSQMQFPANDGRPFCLLRRDEDAVIFRH